MLQARGRSLGGTKRVATCGGPPLGALSGGNWMTDQTAVSSRTRRLVGGRAAGDFGHLPPLLV
jgi:hypothetical protein